MIETPQDPKINFSAALYFLDGHYLLRYPENGRQVSKFLRSGDVAAAFRETGIDSGWLPPGVVRIGENEHGPWYVYSAPAQRVKIFLGDDMIEAPIPRMVLAACRGSFYMFAMQAEHFAAGEKLYQAPFPNVRLDTGSICWGRNQRPKQDPGEARKTWQLFFDSPFNGDYAERKCKSHPADVRVLLVELASSKARKFPASELIEIGIVGKKLEKIIKG